MVDKQRKIPVVSAALVGSAIVLASPANAGNEAMLELLEVLKDNGTISQEAHEVLRNSTLADEEKSTAETKEAVEEQVKEATKDTVKVTTKGKLVFEDQEGEWEWRIGGRIQADGAYYDDDRLEMGNGSEFRRARLYMEGKLWNDWKMKLQYDFADTGDDVIDGIRDAYITYGGFKPTTITVGNFKEPFSLEELTSSKYITFMERALPNVFAPSRNLGAAVYTHGELWTAAAGLFGEGVDSDDVDEGYGFTGRVTFAPIHEETQVIHLGAAGSYRENNDSNELSFSQRPESHVTDVRLVDTGDFDAESFYRLVGEAAVVYGPFSVQGEYVHLSADRSDISMATSDPDFDSYYVEGSYFLTGESRAYDFEKGAFEGIKPASIVGEGGFGAWQVGARFSDLDLSDAGISGGEEQNVTMGLNWYPNANLRFMANYVNVLDVNGGPNDGDEPDVFQFRAQVHW